MLSGTSIEEQRDEAISNRLLLIYEIATLRSQ
jgi:hypothetical protein